MSSYFDYKINNIIGRGSFATVYNVCRKTDNRTFAIKKIKIFNLTTYEKQNIINELLFLYYTTSPYHIKLSNVFVYFNEICFISDYAGK